MFNFKPRHLPYKDGPYGDGQWSLVSRVTSAPQQPSSRTNHTARPHQPPDQELTPHTLWGGRRRESGTRRLTGPGRGHGSGRPAKAVGQEEGAEEIRIWKKRRTCRDPMVSGSSQRNPIGSIHCQNQQECSAF